MHSQDEIARPSGRGSAASPFVLTLFALCPPSAGCSGTPVPKAADTAAPVEITDTGMTTPDEVVLCTAL